MKTLNILSVNISEKKGTIKEPVESITLNEKGIVGDAHAGHWHRQVSLLGIESIDKMQAAADRVLKSGEFAENITTQGLQLNLMNPLDMLISNGVQLQVTQIGKKCHGERCTIFRQTGDCVMPKEGIFCRVIHGGQLKAGDELNYHPKIFKINVITLSDRASQGEYDDQSGPLVAKLISDFFNSKERKFEIKIEVIPDDPAKLAYKITDHTRSKSDFIFTTGGTGIGPRDITPDIIKPMLDKEIPGLMEMIRVKYGMQFPNALISRSIAGVIGRTLIYALPGSPKAVKEYMDEILNTIDHSVMMLNGIDKHG